MTIAEFLRERINEDEAEIGPLFGRDEKASPNGIGWAEVGAIGEVLMCGQARALAECEAKHVQDAQGRAGAILARPRSQRVRVTGIDLDPAPDFVQEIDGQPRQVWEVRR